MWERALDSIPHLEPSAFIDLPEEIRAALRERECRVPQPFFPEDAHNVARGEFAALGQTDWAILCSVGDSAEIVVFWGGPERCPVVLARQSKAAYLQQVTASKIGFSRSISTVDAEHIEEHARRDGRGDAARPPITHDGIDDAFVEKGSSIHYCHAGSWHVLPGAD